MISMLIYAQRTKMKRSNFSYSSSIGHAREILGLLKMATLEGKLEAGMFVAVVFFLFLSHNNNRNRPRREKKRATKKKEENHYLL
jgi:hypothetical protein